MFKTQTSKLFTMTLKEKAFAKVIRNAKLEGLGEEILWSN
jgi:hypothetical protein